MNLLVLTFVFSVVLACSPGVAGYEAYRAAHDQKCDPNDLASCFIYDETKYGDNFDLYQNAVSKIGSGPMYVECNDLTDFTPNSIVALGEIFLQYSGYKTPYPDDASGITGHFKFDITPRRHCYDNTTVYTNPVDVSDWRVKRYLSAGVGNSTCNRSWAYTAAYAIESAYKKATNQVIELSVDYIYECTFDSGDAREKCQGDYPEYILSRVLEKGLVLRSDEAADICQSQKSSINPDKFLVMKLTQLNRSGLMRLMDDGFSPMVVVGLDLGRLRLLQSNIELDTVVPENNLVYRLAYNEPTMFANVYEYTYDTTKQYSSPDVDGFWGLATNVLPCMPIKFTLPMIKDEVYANYAGIAAFAAGVKYHI